MSKLDVNWKKLLKNAKEIEQLSSELKNVESKLKDVKTNINSMGEYGDIVSALNSIIEEVKKEAKCAKEMSGKLDEIGSVYKTTEVKIVSCSVAGIEKNGMAKSFFETINKIKINGTAKDVDRDMPKGYVIVDNMNHIPISDKMRKRLYKKDTGEVDKYGNKIRGYANLNNSKDRPEMAYVPFGQGLIFVSAASFLQFLTSGELLLNYFTGDGSDYHYDANQLIRNDRVKDNFVKNINATAKACEACVKDNEKIIIANSGNAPLSGCQDFAVNDGFFEQVANANTFLAINEAEAGIVCEVSREGNHYSMTYNYYIIDYYDFDEEKKESLYNLNRYGYASNYLGLGKVSGTVEWEAGEEINYEEDIKGYMDK